MDTPTSTEPVRAPVALWLLVLAFAALSLYAIPLNVPAPLGAALPVAAWLVIAYGALANRGLVRHGMLTHQLVVWGLLVANTTAVAVAAPRAPETVFDVLVGTMLAATFAMPLWAGLMLVHLTTPRSGQARKRVPSDNRLPEKG
ncbi:hypothetical protein [Nocardiopsis synnemataformans]|uniref:hypothetical protein n=1 Tax=Nocardiopsis synnemataformans TaxID=61305 RepID=UPI003EBE152D